MGNRAVITTREGMEHPESTLGVYLHWNGGRDSVEAFLKYCELSGFRSPETDSYGWARFCQIVGNYFGGTLSVGIDIVSKLDCDNWDNGVYVIENWKIVDRKFFSGLEQNQYGLKEFLIDLNNAQPEDMKLDEKVFDSVDKKDSE